MAQKEHRQPKPDSTSLTLAQACEGCNCPKILREEGAAQVLRRKKGKEWLSKRPPGSAACRLAVIFDSEKAGAENIQSCHSTQSNSASESTPLLSSIPHESGHRSVEVISSRRKRLERLTPL
jgi:hypothetical protein